MKFTFVIHDLGCTVVCQHGDVARVRYFLAASGLWQSWGGHNQWA
jgi:hypothetical protein